MFNPYDWYVTPEEYEEPEHNGISRGCVNERIRKLCWEKQKAITKPVQVQKTRSEIMAWDIVGVAKAHGISYKQFWNRLYLGWDEQKAATTPLRDAARAREIAFYASECARIHPREVVQLAANNGISYEQFLKRVQDGWDYTRASATPVPRFNGSRRLKELYGEDYPRKFFSEMYKWIFAPGRIKRGEKKKSP